MQKAEVRLFPSKKSYFTSEKFISDSYGRYVIVAGRLLDKQVILVNIYAPNFDDSHFFSRVFTSIPISDDYALIIGGDFNCVLDTSLDRSSSKVIQPSKAAMNIKNLCDKFGLLDPWRFIFPSSRTFSFFSPVHHSYSRIDFFLVDKSLIPLVSSSMYHSIVISDHAPSSFVIGLPTQHSSFKPWRLNSLLLADEEFITYLTNEIKIYLELKGWLTGFFLGLIVFMGCSLACVHAWFFLKTHYFSHNLPLFHTSLSLL